MNDYIENLEAALLDLMDGISVYDIQGNTGLSDERCIEIYDFLHNEVFPNYYKKHGV